MPSKKQTRPEETPPQKPLNPAEGKASQESSRPAKEDAASEGKAESNPDEANPVKEEESGGKSESKPDETKPADKEPAKKKPADETSIDEMPTDEKLEKLLETKGQDAYEKIAELALGDKAKELKPYLKVRCLIFLADPWVRHTRKRLQAVRRIKATLADIARRAAEKYGRKGK